MIRIALIGCGAAAQQLHMPPLLTNRNIRLDWLVDTRLAEVRKLSIRYGIRNVTDDYRKVRDVDAAIVVTPHHLHAPVTEFFLQSGCHVLCEKPLDTRADGAGRLVELAQNAKLVLAVGVFRRYYPTSRLVKNAVASEWLGPVERIDAEEGGQYDWELQSRFMMERDKAGGGVLIDTGSHVLDSILWGFGSCRAQLEEYRDNSMGGVESDCEVKFNVTWNGGNVPVRVELSRLRTLRNTYQIVMANGVLEVPANAPEQAWLLDRNLGRSSEEFRKISLDLRSGPEARSPMSFFTNQINDFCCAIQDRKKSVNSGDSVVPVVALIESCYQNRIPMDEPWMRTGSENAYFRTVRKA